MSATTIEWATDTENLATGCSEARLQDGRMDPACAHCYARLQSARLDAMGNELYAGVARRSGGGAIWTGTFRFDRELMARRFDRMRGGHRVFLGSMTDLWHPEHDPGLLPSLAHEIKQITSRPPEKRPILITLTKRAERLLAWQREHFPDGLPTFVWPGVTAGCQEAVDERVPLLLQVRAHGPRVLSAEPLTGPIVLPVASGLGWVIAGGESGRGARPMEARWARSLRDQCVSAGVPFFFKQWGEWAPDYSRADNAPAGSPWRQDDDVSSRVGKRAAGRLLDGRTWDEIPQETA